MLINAVFNSISVTSRRSLHISMVSWSSFYQATLQAIAYNTEGEIGNVVIVVVMVFTAQ